MTSQRRTIIGACEYSIASIQNLKRDLQDLGGINSELNWAIGGIVATLVSNLIQICDKVFQDAVSAGAPNAKQDLYAIKEIFGDFIDTMVNHE